MLVRDKNDESPTFNKHAYDITIDEELARGRSLPDLDMIVKDNDLVSRLGELFFNLLVYCILKMSCTYVLRVSRIIPGNYVMTNYKVTVYGYHYNRTDCDVEWMIITLLNSIITYAILSHIFQCLCGK